MLLIRINKREREDSIIAGNAIGGAKAAQTNKLRHGRDFYARIGAMGGRNGRTGGFYANRELASRVGRIGGKISKRGPAKPKDFIYDRDPADFEARDFYRKSRWYERLLRRII